MSNREKYMQIGESLTEGQLAYMLEIIEQAKAALDELEDDLYCKELYYAGKDDDSEPVPFEQVLKESGLSVNDLQN